VARRRLIMEVERRSEAGSVPKLVFDAHSWQRHFMNLTRAKMDALFRASLSHMQLPL
jgi:hypothetical protein